MYVSIIGNYTRPPVRELHLLGTKPSSFGGIPSLWDVPPGTNKVVYVLDIVWHALVIWLHTIVIV